MKEKKGGTSERCVEIKRQEKDKREENWSKKKWAFHTVWKSFQKSKEIISQPPPSWIQKAVYRGRHQVCIKPKKKTLQTSTPSRSAANRKKGKRSC